MTPQIEQARKEAVADLEAILIYEELKILKLPRDRVIQQSRIKSLNFALRVLGRCNEEFIEKTVADYWKSGRYYNYDGIDNKDLAQAILQSLIAEKEK